MRTCLMATLALMSACSSRPPPAVDEPTRNIDREMSANAVSETVGSEVAATDRPSRPEANPCLTQGDEAVTHKLKAIGTEPFWAAEVEGRCVTYKTPEDQAGTRVWAHVDSGTERRVWNGALRGRQFQLTVQPAGESGCSDGMSDKTYSLQAVLRVNGETRNGCAETL